MSKVALDRCGPIWRAFSCMLTIGLAACALQHSEPVDDNAAELRVSTDGPVGILFFRDAARCTDRLQVRQPTIGVTSYKIPTNQEFALRFIYAQGSPLGLSAFCAEHIVSFQPEPTKLYTLHYTVGQGSCQWWFTVSVGGHEMSFKPFVRESTPNLTSMGGEGAWCAPKPMEKNSMKTKYSTELVRKT